MRKRHILPIESNRIRLRLLTEDDLPMTLTWRNRDHIRRWFFNSEVVTPEQHSAWFEQYRQRDDDFVFIIEETRSLRRPIGQISLYRIDWANKRAEFGRLLIGDGMAAGRGFAKEATVALLEHAGKQLGLEEIVLEVIKDNLPALAIYQSVGFVPVGETDNAVLMRRYTGARR